MTNEQEFTDALLSNLVKDAAKPLNNNFDDQLMSKIYAEENYRNEVSSLLKTSLRFFLGAICLSVGMLIAALLGKVDVIANIQTLEVLALLVVLTIGILNFDNYKRLINRYSPPSQILKI